MTMSASLTASSGVSVARPTFFAFSIEDEPSF